MSNKTRTGPGGLPERWPLTGSFRRSTPRRAICTSRVLSTGTATRPTSPSNLTPDCFTAATLTPANVSDAKTAVELLEAEARGLEILADGAYGSGGNSGRTTQSADMAQLIKAKPLLRVHPGRFHPVRTSTSTMTPCTVTCPAGLIGSRWPQEPLGHLWRHAVATARPGPLHARPGCALPQVSFPTTSSW